MRLLLNGSIARRSMLLAVAARAGLASVGGQPDFERRIFSRINQIREQSGVEPLQWSDPLAACAKQQSLRKMELRFSGHIDPERGDIAARLTSAGIGWTECGENLFMEKGWDDPVNFAVVSWWYSPGHQANLLKPEFTETAVGLAQGTDKAWFATQIFLAPLVSKTAVRRHQ